MVKVLAYVLVIMSMLFLSCQTGDMVSNSGSDEMTTERVLHRPIGDFISAQGTTNLWQPYGDECAWAENANATPAPKGGWFDWLGFANAYFVAHGGTDLGTQITGDVTEQPIDGGRRVHVTIHGTNVMAWAIGDLVSNPNGWTTGPTTFGAFEQDVFTGATPAIGECHFDWIFEDIYTPGSALPDLVASINVNWGSWPFTALGNVFNFRGNAAGPLHAASGYAEGTPGRLTISQTGHLTRWLAGAHGANADGFPCESIDLHPVGN